MSDVDGTAVHDKVIRHTALHPLHNELSGKMVEFAGYSLPVQFPTGIKTEHLHTRSAAGLFDVSHMGQIRITGESAAKSMEGLVSGDITSLGEFQQRYTLLTNDEGGIIDDLMLTRVPGGISLVVNAAAKESVFEYIKTRLPAKLGAELLERQALFALQGPRSVDVLEALAPGINTLEFMQAGVFQLNGSECLVHRCGYTGEDGFEIAISDDEALSLAETLLKHSDVLPVGLGARDSLRMEAGLCLHGHDIDARTTPAEAGLSWAVAQKYRRGEQQATFPGASLVLKQLVEGTERKLVGLRPEGKIPVREGASILDGEGQLQGAVTSGGFGPSVNGPVALGYVASKLAEMGTELQVEIRKRFHTMRIVKTPFIEHRYHNR